MNFHPDKQLFQDAGTGDQTTDPWLQGQRSTPTPQGTHQKKQLSYGTETPKFLNCPL